MGIGEILGIIIGIFAITAYIAGTIIWAIRLEGKVKTQEATFQLCQKNIDENIGYIKNNIGKLFGKFEEVNDAVSELVGYQRGKANGLEMKRRKED